MTFFGPRDDFLRVYVVVHAQQTPFCFEEELSELTELIYSTGKVTDKAVAIKRLIDKVFAEAQSDIVLLKNKTSGQNLNRGYIYIYIYIHIYLYIY